MQLEDAPRAVGAAVGRRFDERRYGGVEFECARFDFFTELVPGREAVIAREPRLRLVQRYAR